MVVRKKMLGSGQDSPYKQQREPLYKASLSEAIAAFQDRLH
ncbi:MAG: Unknown protein, partial [uncultured Thiotrichaceae bacterium]